MKIHGGIRKTDLKYDKYGKLVIEYSEMDKMEILKIKQKLPEDWTNKEIAIILSKILEIMETRYVSH